MRRADRSSIGDSQVLTRESISAAWEDVPKTPAIKDANAAFDKARSVLNRSDEEWNKRCEQLKILRSIVLQSAELAPPEYLPMIALLTDSLEKALRDLRSQIVKEAALTISFLVSRYGAELRSLAELCLPAAFAQVAVSTKIIASSAALMSVFLVEKIHSKQMFGTISSFVTSKDKNHRRQAVVLLAVVIESWEEKSKKPMMKQLCTLLKTAINDADSETRVAARKTFKVLEEQHPEEAEALFQSVDASKQKLLRAPNGGSSVSSLNGDNIRNTPFRSKLSFGNNQKPPGFLAQRSASVSETKPAMDKVDTSPGGSKFARPALSLGMRTSSCLRNSSLIPAPKSVTNSVIKRREESTPSNIQRVKSNLGPDSFCGSLTAEQAQDFEKKMRLTRYTLRQPSRNADDEFLLPERPAKKNVEEPLSTVDAVLRAVASLSPNEKREGIQKLQTLAMDTTLTAQEVLKIGEALNRLASEVTSPIILDTIRVLVKTHHGKLNAWLVSGLHQLFSMTDAVLPMKKLQVTQTIDCVLQSFDSADLLVALCEIVCSRVIVLKAASRISFLDFFANVLQKCVDADLQLWMDKTTLENTKKTMLKILDWMSDAKNGSSVMPHGKKVLTALYSHSPAVYSSIFDDVDEKHRPLVESVASPPTIPRFQDARNRLNTRRSAPLYLSPKVSTPSPRTKLTTLGPLRPINAEPLENSFRRMEVSPRVPNRESNFGDSEVGEIKENLALMSMAGEQQKLDGLIRMQKMIANGSFTLWNKWYPQVHEALFVVLQTGQEVCKRRALRVIVRVCERRATEILENTSQTIVNVLNCAVRSEDPVTKWAARECLKTLSTNLVMDKVVTHLRDELDRGSEDVQEFVFEMISEMYEKLDDFELRETMPVLAPRLVEAYNNGQSSKVRKGAVRGLQSMRNKMGNTVMQPYLDKLPLKKQELLQRASISACPNDLTQTKDADC